MNNLYTMRVLYEDTDHTGFVHHINILKFFERARQTFIGVTKMQEFWRNNVNFAIVNINVDYKKGAEFGDSLKISTNFEKDGEYKFIAKQEIMHGESDKTIAVAATTLVCINEKQQLIKVPETLKSILLI